MPYPVRYSSQAYIEYEEILDYVVENFGLEKAAQVDLYFEEIISLISINPSLYPYSNKNRGLRRCVLNKQTSLYYRFSGGYIELVSFRGNMMNPNFLL